MTSAEPTTALGVHSEVGALRTVMVHRPDVAHERLTPTNCHELLFDDVIWVRRARQEHDAFVDLMRSRGVEVLLFHELLTETLEDECISIHGVIVGPAVLTRDEQQEPAEPLDERVPRGVALCVVACGKEEEQLRGNAGAHRRATYCDVQTSASTKKGTAAAPTAQMRVPLSAQKATGRPLGVS